MPSGLVALSWLFLVQITDATSQRFTEELAREARLYSTQNIQYDGAYKSIAYPWGDVSSSKGVCADLVIRSYRKLGVDLQKRVHEDMRSNFSAYPSKHVWGLSKPDKNIDHRRVLNLEMFFARHGESLPTSNDPEDYLPGDIVAWNVMGDYGGSMPHIGIVTNARAENGEPLVAHHMGGTPSHDAALFAWPMTGHYRYSVDQVELDDRH